MGEFLRARREQMRPEDVGLDDDARRFEAHGHSDAVIAGRLGISHRTVQTHLARVYVKLGITSRGDIADHLTV
jgi:Bacterial regulatory proteins, luxR family